MTLIQQFIFSQVYIKQDLRHELCPSSCNDTFRLPLLVRPPLPAVIFPLHYERSCRVRSGGG